MRKTITYAIFVITLFSVTNASASPTCDIFNKSPTSQHGVYFLTIVDATLVDWPKNKKLKTMMADSERIGIFKDTIKKVTYYCKNNQDFKAGAALGEDLFLYKKMISELE